MPNTFTEEIKTRIPGTMKKHLRFLARQRGLGHRGMSIIAREAFAYYLGRRAAGAAHNGGTRKSLNGSR